MTTEWDSEKLARLIEERKAIYDFNMKEHSNKLYIEQLWAEVAAGMRSTVVDCKSKWTSMRNSYARYLRDVKNAAYGGVKKRKWYLADCMTFLNDFMGQNKKSPNSWDTMAEDSMDRCPDDEDEREANQYFATEMVDSDISRHVPRSRIDAVPNDPSLDMFHSEADLLFFRSLLADMNKLSERRKRRFKEMIMASLHSLIDSQEDERSTVEHL